jgi:hypothetical protein
VVWVVNEFVYVLCAGVKIFWRMWSVGVVWTIPREVDFLGADPRDHKFWCVSRRPPNGSNIFGTSPTHSPTHLLTHTRSSFWMIDPSTLPQTHWTPQNNFSLLCARHGCGNNEMKTTKFAVPFFFRRNQMWSVASGQYLVVFNQGLTVRRLYCLIRD